MAATSIKRRLVTILAADAVAYSRHMAMDEEGTMRILSAHRAVIDGIIAFHEGRIVNTAGDSVLAEFSSSVEAVRCAVEIQDALRTRNDSLDESQRLLFRIGINLGDVMVKGDDLLGDGVNIAARLEAVAEPGGICVSSSVYEQIAGKLNLGFVDMGSRDLKNIERPIRIYRVTREGHDAELPVHPPAARKTRRRRWVGVSAAVGVLAVLAGYLLMAQGPPKPSPAEVDAAKERMLAKERLAEVQAEAQAAKKRAQASAEAAAVARRELEEQRVAEARARAEAELARAKAEVEATRRKAAADLAAASQAAAAKRQLEEQRAAQLRAKAEAELARARAEAEAVRRKAADELAVSRAQRPPQPARDEPAAQVANANTRSAMAGAQVGIAPPSTAHGGPTNSRMPSPTSPDILQGEWSLRITCPSAGDFPERTIETPLTTADNGFSAEHGEPGAPGFLAIRGIINADGSVVLRGKGISGRRGGARPYPAGFYAKPVENRYEGRGRLGKRDCALAIDRAQ